MGRRRTENWHEISYLRYSFSRLYSIFLFYFMFFFFKFMYAQTHTRSIHWNEKDIWFREFTELWTKLNLVIQLATQSFTTATHTNHDYKHTHYLDQNSGVITDIQWHKREMGANINMCIAYNRKRNPRNAIVSNYSQWNSGVYF